MRIGPPLAAAGVTLRDGGGVSAPARGPRWTSLGEGSCCRGGVMRPMRACSPRPSMGSARSREWACAGCPSSVGPPRSRESACAGCPPSVGPPRSREWAGAGCPPGPPGRAACRSVAESSRVEAAFPGPPAGSNVHVLRVWALRKTVERRFSAPRSRVMRALSRFNVAGPAEGAGSRGLGGPAGVNLQVGKAQVGRTCIARSGASRSLWVKPCSGRGPSPRAGPWTRPQQVQCGWARRGCRFTTAGHPSHHSSGPSRADLAGRCLRWPPRRRERVRRR